MKNHKKAKLYFEELRKLIKKCPKGYELNFDIDKGLFMCASNAEFNHGAPYEAPPAALCSVGASYNPHKKDTDGYMEIIADPISLEYVNLAAYSSNAQISD